MSKKNIFLKLTEKEIEIILYLNSDSVKKNDTDYIIEHSFTVDNGEELWLGTVVDHGDGSDNITGAKQCTYAKDFKKTHI